MVWLIGGILAKFGSDTAENGPFLIFNFEPGPGFNLLARTPPVSRVTNKVGPTFA